MVCACHRFVLFSMARTNHTLPRFFRTQLKSAVHTVCACARYSPRSVFFRVSKGSYTKEEGMQLNGNHVDGEILSVTKNKYAFTEVS